MLLAVPIGMFMHLVFDGVFARTTAFWWPFTGAGFGADRLPSFDRGWWNVPLELVGALLALWVLRTVRGATAGATGDTRGAGSC